MIEFKINVHGGWLLSSKVKEGLAEEFGGEITDVELKGAKSRGIDPSIIVALVTATGTALCAFIGGVLRVAQQSSIKRIIVQKGDVKIDVPLKISKEKLQQVVESLKSLDEKKVELYLED